MADQKKYIRSLPYVTLPLTGSEAIPVEQGGVTKRMKPGDYPAVTSGFIKIDGTTPFSGDQSMNGHRLKQIASPEEDDDAVRLIDLKNAQDWKELLLTLPSPLSANSVYVIKSGNSVQMFFTDSAATAFGLNGVEAVVSSVNGKNSNVTLSLTFSGGKMGITGGNQVNLDLRYLKITDAYTNRQVDEITGLKDNLNTTTKSNLVAAINELLLSVNEGMRTPEPLDCSANPDYPASEDGDTYKVTVKGKIGGENGKNVGVNDTIVCTITNTGGDEATVGGSFYVIGGNVNDATESIKGVGRIATQEEVDAGTVDKAWITPKTLAGVMANRVIHKRSVNVTNNNFTPDFNSYDVYIVKGGNGSVSLNTPVNMQDGDTITVYITQVATDLGFSNFIQNSHWGDGSSPISSLLANKHYKFSISKINNDYYLSYLTYSYENSNNSLIAYYKLNSDASDALGDYSGTSNPGVLYSSAYGKVNSGAHIADNDGVVVLPESLLEGYGYGDLTVCAWAKLDVVDSGNLGGIVSLGNYSSGHQFGIGCRSGQWAVWGFGGGYNSFGGNQDTNWHFFTVTLSRSDSENLPVYKFYVDGDLKASKSINMGFGYVNNSNILGGYKQSGNSVAATFHGSIDEVGIWTRVLTLDEIIFFYNSGNGRTYPFA